VINNGYLGMVRQWQHLFYEDRLSQVALPQDLPDLVKLADAYGIPGFRVQTVEELDTVLAAHGYEPYDDDGTRRLRNCPFHRLATAHTDLVCGMNLALLSALAEAVGAPGEAVLDPAPDRCCCRCVRCWPC
jgi:predicted ArsR family transcriptional regulator